MASYCNQCATDLAFPTGDMLGPTLASNQIAYELCEGCGSTWVNRVGDCVGPCDVKAHWDDVAKGLAASVDVQASMRLKKKWEAAK